MQMSGPHPRKSGLIRLGGQGLSICSFEKLPRWLSCAPGLRSSTSFNLQLSVLIPLGVVSHLSESDRPGFESQLCHLLAVEGGLV